MPATVGNRLAPRGQATVEMALVLPVVVTLLLAVVQVGLLVRDQLSAVNAARAAARAVAVRPVPAEADRVLGELGLAGRASVRVSGQLRPGGLATVTVELEPTRVPVVGSVVSRVHISEQMTSRVEGP